MRTIDELSKLDTFADCTDEEIKSLIDYNYQLGFDRGYHGQLDERIESAIAEQRRCAEVARQNAMAAFANAMAVSPTFREVSA